MKKINTKMISWFKKYIVLKILGTVTKQILSISDVENKRTNKMQKTIKNNK